MQGEPHYKNRLFRRLEFFGIYFLIMAVGIICQNADAAHSNVFSDQDSNEYVKPRKNFLKIENCGQCDRENLSQLRTLEHIVFNILPFNQDICRLQMDYGPCVSFSLPR